MDQLSCISPLLDCDLRITREWRAVLVERCRIPNHKYLGMSRYGEVILDAHPPGAICLDLQPFACRRGRDAGCPDHSLTRDAHATHHHAVRVDVIDALPQTHLDTQLLNPFLPSPDPPSVYSLPT